MSRRATAFTLVELLVVIGIIALLISILLPALNRARRAANTAACLSNMRQVGQAWMMYANAYKGYVPPVSDEKNIRWSSGATRQKAWPEFLMPFLGSVRDEENLSESFPAIQRSVLNGCTAEERSREVPWNGPPGNAFIVYQGNYAYAWRPYANLDQPRGFFDDATWVVSWAPKTRYVKITEWKPSTQRGVFSEKVPSFKHDWKGVQDWPPHDGRSGVEATTMDYWRHGTLRKRGSTLGANSDQRSINVVFADGHGETCSPDEAYYALHAPNRK